MKASVGQPLAEVPWGASLAWYFMLIGAASGITLLCWWIRPRDDNASQVFERLAAWLTLVVLSISGVILIVDLGRPERFFLMLTEFSNIGSVMSVGAKLIALKGLLIGVYLYLLHRRKEAFDAGDRTLAPGVTRWIYRAVPAVLGLASLGLAIYPASLLSRTWLSPLSNSAGAGLVFLITALLMGAAFAVIVAAVIPAVADDLFRERVTRMLIFLICAEGLVLVFEALSLNGNHPLLANALYELAWGGASRVFWGVVVFAGLVAPLAGLLIMPRQRIAAVICASFVIVGAGATRYLFFVVR